MDAPDDRLDRLVAVVAQSAKYRSVAPDFVRRVASQELAHRRDWKEALKATKNKLHQVGGAYQDTAPDYARWLAELDTLLTDPQDPALREACRRMLRQHASTRERLPILDEFYTRTLEPVGPLASVLDLACGLNPLCAPWMPLAPGAAYYACDIYLDLLVFVETFMKRLGLRAEGFPCDLTAGVPDRPVQLALLLKTLPCLEQVEKGVSLRLLDGVRAEWLLVSFPAHSLGGRAKGMPENYAGRFRQLLTERPWPYTVFEFTSELAFLVHKGKE